MTPSRTGGHRTGAPGKKLRTGQSALQFPLLLAILACAAFALTGCSAPKAADSRVKLVVWGLQFGEESKGLDARVEAFKRMHPEIDVSVLSMGGEHFRLHSP